MSEEKKIAIIELAYDTPDPDELNWAFPDVDPGMEPLGGRVIVQLRRIKKKAGRIIIVDETKENEKWNNMIGKVMSLGPLAYKNRENMQPWPEGAWANVGDFVRVPKYGGDRWEINDPNDADNQEPVLFVTVNDHELISRITSNPLKFKAYV